MKNRKERKKAIKCLEKIAFGKSNDAVKLILADPESAFESLDDLDLTMLSRIKRGAKGEVEVSLISRLDAIRLLLEVTEEEKAESGAAQFIKAISGISGEIEAGDGSED